MGWSASPAYRAIRPFAVILRFNRGISTALEIVGPGAPLQAGPDDGGEGMRFDDDVTRAENSEKDHGAMRPPSG